MVTRLSRVVPPTNNPQPFFLSIHPHRNSTPPSWSRLPGPCEIVPQPHPPTFLDLSLIRRRAAKRPVRSATGVAPRRAEAQRPRSRPGACAWGPRAGRAGLRNYGRRHRLHRSAIRPSSASSGLGQLTSGLKLQRVPQRMWVHVHKSVPGTPCRISREKSAAGPTARARALMWHRSFNSTRGRLVAIIPRS